MNIELIIKVLFLWLWLNTMMPKNVNEYDNKQDPFEDGEPYIEWYMEEGTTHYFIIE